MLPKMKKLRSLKAFYWEFSGWIAWKAHDLDRAVHELERDVVARIDTANIIDFRDIRVIELARDRRFIPKHRDEFLVFGHRRQDPLESNPSAGFPVHCPEHLGHAEAAVAQLVARVALHTLPEVVVGEHLVDAAVGEPTDDLGGLELAVDLQGKHLPLFIRQ